MIFKKQLIIFLAIFILGINISHDSALAAEFCAAEGYTIATINGILTNEEDAKRDKDSLEKIFGNSWRNEFIDYQYLYNPTYGKGLLDLVDSGKQKRNDGKTVADYDMVKIFDSASENIKTQKLLFVPHSQGSFYANTFYDIISERGEAVSAESMGIYAIATPSDRVAGGGKWLTSTTDKIIADWVAKYPFRSIMDPNTSIELQKDDEFLGHDFRNVYLKHRGARMVADIQESLDKLVAHDNKPGECIRPLKVNKTLYEAKEVALIGLDSFLARVVEAGEGTVKTVIAANKFVKKASDVLSKLVPSGDTTYLTTNANLFDRDLPLVGEPPRIALSQNNKQDQTERPEKQEKAEQKTKQETKQAKPTNVSVQDDEAYKVVLLAQIENLKKRIEIVKKINELTKKMEEIKKTEKKDVEEAEDEAFVSLMVNINTAGLEELQKLSGIGPATAQKIIDYRNQNGLFRNIEDIKNVSGIGQAKFLKIKDYITVGDVSTYTEPKSKIEVDTKKDNDKKINENKKKESKEKNKNSLKLEPVVAVAAPSLMKADEKIGVVISIFGLDNSIYDIKVSIESDGILSDTYNDGVWKSSNFYVKNKIYGPNVSGEEIRLMIDEEKQDFRGQANLIIKVRKNGSGSAETIYSEDINILAPVFVTQNNDIEDEDSEEEELIEDEELDGVVYKLLISEIQTTGGAGKTTNDFVRIYNPNDTQVNLNGYRLVKRTAEGVTDTLMKSWPEDELVESHGFYLWANSAYEGISEDIGELPNVTTSASIADNNGVAIWHGANDEGEIIDSIGWGESVNEFIEGSVFVTNPEVGQVLKRKALVGEECVSPEGIFDEFTLCDTDDNANDFILIGDVLVEDVPEVESLNVIYDAEKLELNFSWSGVVALLDEKDLFTYKVEAKDSGEVIFETELETEFSYRIYEVGRKYDFLLHAYDAEGVETMMSEVSIDIPSFVYDVALYNSDYYAVGGESSGSLLEFSYDKYPFLPLDLVYTPSGTPSSGPNYKVAVFYLNREAPKHEFLHGSNPLDEDSHDVLMLKYESCAGSRSFRKSLKISDVESGCNNNGGQGNGSIRYLEHFADGDNHLLFPAQAVDAEYQLSLDDYVTVAFYGFYRDYPQGSSDSFAFDTFKLLAVDKQKYNFQDEVPEHIVPNTLHEVEFRFDETKSELTTTYGVGNDPDTQDFLLRYEISYDGGIAWEQANLSPKKILEPGTEYDVQVRAVDDFGLVSESNGALYASPEILPPLGLSNIQWGNLDESEGLELTFHYDNYPFIPGSGNYDMAVFYLNSLPPERLGQSMNFPPKFTEYSSISLKYLNCQDSAPEDFGFLMLSKFEQPKCTSGGGSPQKSSLFPAPEIGAGGSFTFPINELYNTERELGELTEDDYITVGFYGIDSHGNTTNIANDAHRYYFTE